MGDLLNLRIARKRAKRREAEQEAARRRVAFGLSKAERKLARAKSDKAQKDLDHRRIETGEGP
jgi:hypothetical protein